MGEALADGNHGAKVTGHVIPSIRQPDATHVARDPTTTRASAASCLMPENGVRPQYVPERAQLRTQSASPTSVASRPPLAAAGEHMRTRWRTAMGYAIPCRLPKKQRGLRTFARLCTLAVHVGVRFGWHRVGRSCGAEGV